MPKPKNYPNEWVTEGGIYRGWSWSCGSLCEKNN